MFLRSALLALVACDNSGPGTQPTTTDDTGTTPTDPGGSSGGGTTPTTTSTTTGGGTTSTAAYGRPTVLEATCVADPNPLRFSCDVTVDPPQPVEISFVRASGTGLTRVHTSEAVSGTHTIPLYFMGPAQDYDVTVSATAWPVDPTFVTTVTTGQPPFDIGSTLVTREGASTVPMMGTELPCEGDAIAVIYDTATGELVWYHNLDANGTLGLLDMVRFTKEKTILGETDEEVSEVDLTGAQVTRFDATGLGGCCGPHHDNFKWNDQYYLMHQYYPDFGLTLDALVIYDSVGNELAHWYPDQFLTIPGSASGDYFHTNTIFVDDNGDILLNYLTQETFVKIEGDLASPDFGQPIWIMSPGNQGGIGNDFAVDWSQVGGADTIGFQHNLNIRNDGRLMVLDNTNGRGLVISYDEVNMTATVDAAYDTYENSCGPQGTAMDTLAGNAIVACNTEWLREYDLKTSAKIWEAEVTCRNGGAGGFFGGVAPTRWYPIEGW
jgi:hypothetical protein